MDQRQVERDMAALVTGVTRFREGYEQHLGQFGDLLALVKDLQEHVTDLERRVGELTTIVAAAYRKG